MFNGLYDVCNASILLDGTVQDAKILDFLDISYDLTDGRIEESIE